MDAHTTVPKRYLDANIGPEVAAWTIGRQWFQAKHVLKVYSRKESAGVDIPVATEFISVSIANNGPLTVLHNHSRRDKCQTAWWFPESG
jgi:hypothetical protein